MNEYDLIFLNIGVGIGIFLFLLIFILKEVFKDWINDLVYENLKLYLEDKRKKNG